MEYDPTAVEPDDEHAEDDIGEPDRDGPPKGIDEPGSDERMDPEVRRRVRGEV